MKRPSAASLVLFGFSLGLVATSNAASLGSAVFPDIRSGMYYDEAVGEMYADGIITGYENGNFGPSDYVTRGQVAVMMQRFKESLGFVSSSRSSSSRSSTGTSSSSSSSSSSQATVEDEGAFRFTTGSFKADEDEGTVTITIIRYGGNTGTVSVDYETENGTANSGDDYDSTTGTLTFASGKTSASFQVPINDDSEKEGNETVLLHLKDPTNGAVLGSPVLATLTIVDDDEGDGASTDPDNNNGVFVFSASEYQIGEDMDDVTVTIERKSGTEGSVTVQYEAKDGTADSEHYDSISATSVTFNDGESTKTFDVTILDNNELKGNKTVNLRLLSPTGGASLGSLSTATLTIVDDENEVVDFDNGGFRFEDEEYNASEGEPLVIRVDRMGGALGEVTVQYATQNTLAKAGDDYTEASGTLTFKEGEAQKLITIPILDDDKNDPNETFKVHLSSPTGGATLETPSSTTVTIN